MTQSANPRADSVSPPRRAGAAFVAACLCCVSLPGRADPQMPAKAAPAASAPAASKPAPTTPPIAEIVVSGERPAVETRVDRTIYNLSRELQATAGSAADVLGNLPSVSVDVDGNPSLRGDGDVQILIDGRPAPQFNGANRGAALQQLGADSIDRIEIITNPPANMKRDGSAGIINIITKRPTGAHTATAQASLGSGGRYNVSTSQGAQRGKLAVRGAVSLRHDLRIRDIESSRIVSDNGGVLTDREGAVHALDDRLSKTATLGADYDATDADRLTAEGSFYRRDADSNYNESISIDDGSNAALTRYDRSRRAQLPEYESSATLRYHHDGENDGDGLTVTAERTFSSELTPLRLTTTWFVPAQAPTFQIQRFDEEDLTREFSVDYVATLAEGKLTTGYDLERTDDRFDDSQTIPGDVGGAALPDPDFTNLFRLDQTTHALYGSYERPLGRWTVLGGLRLEQTELGVNRVTSAERSSQDYFRLFPTLHLSEKLDERQTLKFSYGRRIIRPFGQALNPYRVPNDPFTFHQGNPDLAQTEVDSVEAGWQYDADRTSLGATAYARRRHNDFTSITTTIGPSTTLETYTNLGESVSGGVEFAASGRLASGLDVNVSGNVYYNEIDAGNLGFTRKRSTYAFDVKAAMNWRIAADDTLQVNARSFGKRLTPQGYLAGTTTLDLGYRHNFRPNFSLTATVADVFASRRFASVIDTDELDETSRVRFPGRIVFVGFTWSLPGAKTPQDKFEYGE
jgi:outer membrane receptor protein involved in Fe transport